MDCLLPKFNKKTVEKVVDVLMNGGESGPPTGRILIDYVESQVSAGHSPSVSEFVVKMLKLHYEGGERDAIEQKVLAAFNADDASEVTPQFWDSLRNGLSTNEFAR